MCTVVGLFPNLFFFSITSLPQLPYYRPRDGKMIAKEGSIEYNMEYLVLTRFGCTYATVAAAVSLLAVEQLSSQQPKQAPDLM